MLLSAWVCPDTWPAETAREIATARPLLLHTASGSSHFQTGNLWTSRAKTILWRNMPYECPVDFSGDYRFKAAADHAIATIPADIEAQIRDLTADPSDLMNLHKLNWLFFERWRLGDGWLRDDSGGKPLAIFRDDLALSVSAEVARRICT